MRTSRPSQVRMRSPETTLTWAGGPALARDALKPTGARNAARSASVSGTRISITSVANITATGALGPT